MRPDMSEVFCEEMPRRICVVTNGTFPLRRFEKLYFYWVSLDGTEEIHDKIQGKGILFNNQTKYPKLYLHQAQSVMVSRVMERHLDHYDH